MGILDKEESGQAVFVSSTKIAVIRARREEKESQKVAAKEEKERERKANVVEKAKKT